MRCSSLLFLPLRDSADPNDCTVSGWHRVQLHNVQQSDRNRLEGLIFVLGGFGNIVSPKVRSGDRASAQASESDDVFGYHRGILHTSSQSGLIGWLQGIPQALGKVCTASPIPAAVAMASVNAPVGGRSCLRLCQDGSWSGC